MRVFIIFFISILFLGLQKSQASHAAGADLTYRHIGGNSYEFLLKFYRACESGSIEAPEYIYMYTNAPSCGINNVSYILNKDVPVVDITPLCASVQSMCNGGIYAGYEEHIYRATITINQPCTDYSFAACIPTRNSGINTLENPGQTPLCVESTLNSFYGVNNSPSFSYVPISFLCVAQQTCITGSATDVDGDSITYELTTPLTTANPSCSNFTTPTGYYSNCPPPLGNVTYKLLSPYSFLNPIMGTTTLSTTTGDLCFTPTQQEIGVVAIKIKEYRNGILIGSIIRDIQLNVLASCNNSNPDLSDIHGGTSSSLDTTICPNTAVILNIGISDLDGNNVTATYLNSIPGANIIISGSGTPSANLNFTWTPNASNVSNTPYCFTVSVKDDHCPYFGSSTKTFCLYVKQPSVNITSAGPFCENATLFNLTATPNTGIHIWSGIGIVDPNLGTFDPAVSGTGQHWVTYQHLSALGCLSEDSMMIDINESPLADAGIDTNICQSGVFNNMNLGGSPTGSFGKGPYSYDWSPSVFLLNPTSQKPSLLLPVDTFFTVLVTDALGCTDQDTVYVSYFNQPIADAGSDLSVCSNSLAQDTLGGPTGSASYTYIWSPSNWVSNDAIANPILTLGNTGVISVMVIDSNGCTSTDSITINFAISPTADAGLDFVSCGQNQDTIGGAPTASGSTGPYTYKWLPADGLSDSSKSNPVLNFTSDITYIIEVTDANGCTATDTVYAEFIGIDADFDMIPENNFAPTNVLFDNESSGATDYSWEFGDGGSSSSTNPKHFYNGSGSYVIELIAYNDKTGCLDTARKTLDLDGSSQIFVPNIITPNNDGQNDVFTITSRNLTEFECAIYNRWGTELYQFNEVQNNWDGYTYSGKKAPNGTYFYLITASGEDGSEYNFKGTFFIAR